MGSCREPSLYCYLVNVLFRLVAYDSKGHCNLLLEVVFLQLTVHFKLIHLSPELFDGYANIFFHKRDIIEISCLATPSMWKAFSRRPGRSRRVYGGVSPRQCGEHGTTAKPT